MKINYSSILIFLLFILPSAVKADPNVSVYIDNVSYNSATEYEFDIMIKANGATTAFDLRTFQAGLYLNPAWVNGGTIGVQNVSTYTQMNTPGYNGVFSWNATDKLINCSVNIGVRPSSNSCVSTSITSTPVNVTRLRLTNSVDFTCFPPDIKFNYVNNISPLRLRTSFSWRESGCTTNYEMFYPGRPYTGSALFNGEVYTTNDADSKSPESAIGNTGFCYGQLQLTAFLQGYYLGGGQMQAVMFNQMVNHANMEQTDSIMVELHVTNPVPVVYSTKAILHTNGSAYCLFPSAAIGKTGRIVIRHRNTIETWSASEITLSSRHTYNFSLTDASAFGSNLADVTGNWAMYSGDLNQDGFIDVSDFPAYDLDNLNLVEGQYVNTDLNGDGFVDVSDFPVYDLNNLNLVEAMIP